MIQEYLPLIFAITHLLLGTLLAIKSFKIYTPKNRTQEEIAKSEDWHKKFGTLMQIISIILIAKGTYDLISLLEK